MITIAIDGFSACGKSTLAKHLARELNYRFIDTGAMYRAITLHFLRREVDLESPEAVDEALAEITVDFQSVDGKNHVILNGEDVESEIRGMVVSQLVSPVAAKPAVRKFLVAQQRRMGARGGIVMDGRDIGTVVFPEAELKIFVTAELEARVNRRLAEFRQAGKNATRAEIEKNLVERDLIDSTRKHSPLKRAEDAILLDNTHLSFEDFLARGMELAREALERED